jgi:molybdopterin synthase catalytic subunit
VGVEYSHKRLENIIQMALVTSDAELLTYEPLDTAAAYNAVRGDRCGGICVFVGATRNDFETVASTEESNGNGTHQVTESTSVGSSPSDITTQVAAVGIGRVVHLEYEAHCSMARTAMKAIAASAADKYAAAGLRKVYVAHRLGNVAVSEPSVLVAVGCEHRKEAFGACEFIIDEIKRVVPIWKMEVYDNGTKIWKENCVGCSSRASILPTATF